MFNASLSHTLTHQARRAWWVRVSAVPSVGFHHQSSAPAWSRAARILGGDIGNAVRRRWMALSMALAIAAIGGTMFTSPTPLAPKGWAGLGTSTKTASI